MPEKIIIKLLNISLSLQKLSDQRLKSRDCIGKNIAEIINKQENIKDIKTVVVNILLALLTFLDY